MTNYTSLLTEDGFIILLLHGVISNQSYRIRNYTRKHILVDRFIKILGELSANGTPTSMPEIVRAHRGKDELPERAFAITFDDGFFNNYSVVAPILVDFNVPATFYITTGFVEHNCGSWIDRIEYSFERTTSFEVQLPLGVRHCETVEQKIKLLEYIRNFVKNDPHTDPYQFADDICRQLGVEMFEPDPQLDQKMSWIQLRELSANPLFTIGGHSHSHRILSYLGLDDLEHEVEKSLRLLRQNLLFPVEHYSYPEGLANSYSEQVIKVLKREGILCSPSAEPGVNRNGDNLFHLKRIMAF